MAPRRDGDQDQDWAQQVPNHEYYRGPYEDYGWEPGESIMPEFRDPSTRRMWYDRPGEPYPQGSQRGQGSRGGQGRYAESYYGSTFAGGRYGRSANWEGTQVSPEDWYRPGPYTGRGPKNYQRSDARIRDEVSDRLMAHGWIDASDIEVIVENGEVTLQGTVDTRRTKRMAEDVAESVPGVKDVHNELKIQPGQKS